MSARTSNSRQARRYQSVDKPQVLYNLVDLIMNCLFLILEHLLRRNVKRFRRGLVFKAHRLFNQSTLGWRVMKKIEIEEGGWVALDTTRTRELAPGQEVLCPCPL